MLDFLFSPGVIHFLTPEGTPLSSPTMFQVSLPIIGCEPLFLMMILRACIVVHAPLSSLLRPFRIMADEHQKKNSVAPNEIDSARWGREGDTMGAEC